MKRLFMATVLACAAAFAHAESGWVNIASTGLNDMLWDVKSGSLEFTKTKGGAVIAVVIGRITNTKTSRIDLYKWYVSAIDCKKQIGKVVTLDIDGTYKFENDFVFGSGNVATAMAEAICGAADYSIKKVDEKSL